MDELVDSLEALGHTVVVNGKPDDVLPMPPALRPRAAGIANALPAVGGRQAIAWFRWRRRARRALMQARIARILVWDPVVAVVCGAAAPRGVEVVWISPSDTAVGRRVRVVNAAARRWADRTIRLAPARPAFGAALIDGWVVFGSTALPKKPTLDRLRAHANAASAPALALVFDGRVHEALTASAVEELVAATGARAVWWCSGDEWVTRLGGVPATAVDTAVAYEPDHRHVRALTAGARVVRIDGTELSQQDLGELLADERDWAAAVSGDAP